MLDSALKALEPMLDTDHRTIWYIPTPIRVRVRPRTFFKLNGGRAYFIVLEGLTRTHYSTHTPTALSIN